MLTSALGCLGAALSIALPWPQVWRCWAGRRTTGLSAGASWLGVALPIGWITYGLLLGDRIQVVTNTVTGAAGLAVLVALLGARLDLRRGRKLLATAAGAAIVLAAVALSGLAAALPGYDGAEIAPLLGGLLAGASVVAAFPQPVSLLRDRTQDLSGLSPLRWQLAAGACASWFGYGLATGQVAVWASASAGLLSALVVCAVLVVRGAAGSAPDVVVPAVSVPAVVPAGSVPADSVPVGSVPAGSAVVAVASVPGATVTAGPLVARGVACAPSRGPARTRSAPRPVRGTPGVGPRPVRGTAGVGPKPVRGPVRPVRSASRAAADAPTLILHDLAAA
jgi:hypothetical protein